MLLDQLLILGRFHRLHQRQMFTTLERLPSGKWNNSHIGLLSILADEPKATAEIASLIGLSKQATSVCIRELESRRLVGIRSRSPHVRVQLVYLTGEGWSFLSRWVDELAALDRRYASLIGDEELQRLKDTMALVNEAFETFEV